MERIKLNMSMKDVIVVVCDGNPGAVNVCCQLLEGEGGLTDMLRMDAASIHGPNIWVAYKDVCGEDIKVMRGKLRSGELETLLKENSSYQYYLKEQEAGK